MNEPLRHPLPKIGAPAIRALASIDVTQLEQLAQYSPDELLKLHGFGPKSIRILTVALNDLGLSFRKES